MAVNADGGHDPSTGIKELAALYQVTDGLYRAQSRAEALDAAIDGIVSVLGSRASILLFDKTGVMRFVSWRGLSDGYRTRLEGHSPWRLGDGDAEPIPVRDIGQSDEPEWVKSAILGEGIRGLAFIPVMSSRRVVGKFMTYYPDPHDFTAAEIRLAVAIARQLGFSLERQQAEAARRAAEGELRESEERFRLMSELAPVMIWTSDAQGRCLHLNKLLRDFWGTGDDLSDFNWQTTMHPEDAAHIGAAMQQAIATQAPTVVDGRYRRSDGAFRILSTDARPRFAPDGTFLGMIGVNVDVTESREAELALRKSEDRWHRFGETSSQVLWIRDAASLQWEYLSPAFDRLYGVTREDALRDDNFASWLALIAPDDRDPMLAHIERVRAGEVSTVEFRVPRPTDGQVRRFRANAFPMRGTDGVVRQIGGIEADVTEERLAAERLELMVAELQHRTRNLIAVVQSIASQTFKNSDSLDAFRQSFSERLAALSRVQGLLSRSNLEPITMDALVKLELAALNDGKVSIAGPRVTLDKAIVQTLALALHELATNARKHGALSTPEGRIAVTWDTTSHPDGQQALCLRWLETGIGPTSGRDSGSGTGYGRTLIERALAYTLGARTTFNLSEDGLRCIIELPLKAQAP